MPVSEKTCKFYPYFCSCIGHNSAASTMCEMHGKSKAEKDMALSQIKEEGLGAQISKVQSECKSLMFYT